jgi:hypothetical protein
LSIASFGAHCLQGLEYVRSEQALESGKARRDRKVPQRQRELPAALLERFALRHNERHNPDIFEKLISFCDAQTRHWRDLA